MEKLKVDVTKLMTQTEYAKSINVTPAAVVRMIREGRIKGRVVKIKGATLISVE